MSNTMKIITWPSRNMCMLQDDYDTSILGMLDTPLSLPENKEAIFSFIGEQYKNKYMDEIMYDLIDFHRKLKKGILLENEDGSFSDYLEYEEYGKYFEEQEGGE